MPLVIGSRFGPYDVVAKLGEGGMGEVYRARDAALNRDVALKILAPAFADDADRLARFEREAQVLASLNHPHIAQIYGLERQDTQEGQERQDRTDGSRALVLELVEGPTLADRIAQGPVPLDEAIEIARQLIGALEAAHEQGIIHRDLKPANIKLRPDGTVKVLDFGLAKAFDPTSSSVSGDRPSISMSPTLTAATQLGMILGTAAYMAPEQARGKPVDKRADIWAFGCVLYEMVSGRRPFAGEEVSDTLAYVITKDVDWVALPTTTPRHIRRLLRRCLEKDPKKRLRDIGDARVELEEGTAREEPASSATAPTPASKPSTVRRALPWIAGLVAGGALTATVAFVARPRPAALPVQRLSLVMPATTPYVGQVGGELAISPDGTRLVYPAVQGGVRLLYMRRLDQLDAQPIRGTDDGFNPFFSPDGEWIGFFSAGGSVNGKLKKVAVRGGPALTLGDTSVPTGGWLSDDSILFTRSDGQVWSLYRVPAAGGGATKFATPATDQKEQRFGWPEPLPDGKNILLSVTMGAPGFDQSRVVVMSLETGKHRTVVEQGYHARYVSSGHIVYALGANLMAVPFDVRRLITTGPPVPLVEGVRSRSTTGEICFGVSSTGFLVYQPGTASVGAQRTLTWVDRTGKEEAVPAPARSYVIPRLSPDGTRVALDVRDQDNDIWVWDLARHTLRRLTFDPGVDSFPVWTPDAKRIIFSSVRSPGITNLSWQAADGTGQPERLVESPVAQVPQSVSPDGTQLVFRQADTQTSLDLYTLPLSGERRPAPLLRTTFTEQNADISPDGRWVAYQSNESGQNEIYVRPFPRVETGKWQISTNGGTRPLWSRDGRELFYMTGPADVRSRVMASSIAAGAAFSATTPQMLFEGPYYSGGGVNPGRTFDVSADGSRFLMIRDQTTASGTSTDAPLVVVLNFFDELKRVAQPKR
jgi:eukaryotic-like serine/threonine-protein kinase